MSIPFLALIDAILVENLIEELTLKTGNRIIKIGFVSTLAIIIRITEKMELGLYDEMIWKLKAGTLKALSN